MKSYCVVVANGARARFFHLGESNSLLELDNLVNPEAEAAGKALFSDDKSGRNAAPLQAGAHGYDDHRNRHEEEMAQRFAGQIADQAVKLTEQQQANRLVVVANDRLLGHLRQVLKIPPTSGVQIEELAKDLTKLNPTELHEHLATDGMIPARSTTA